VGIQIDKGHLHQLDMDARHTGDFSAKKTEQSISIERVLDGNIYAVFFKHHRYTNILHGHTARHWQDKIWVSIAVRSSPLDVSKKDFVDRFAFFPIVHFLCVCAAYLRSRSLGFVFTVVDEVAVGSVIVGCDRCSRSEA